MKHPQHRFLLGALFLQPLPALASDPTGMIVLLYGVLVAGLAITFFFAWLLTRSISAFWLKLLIRTAVVCAFLTPVQIGNAGYWWAAPFVVMEPKLLATAISSIVIATFVDSP
ncbi:hypothetical protein ABQE70_16485 [Xanthomonas campestris pv. campestris]|uniref:hypothetical protein n=1 Tax=Xanthomonas campestris TaxID=339 RepID=UPI0032E4D4BE